MKSVSRLVAFAALAVFAIGATGCGGNAKKLVGKWKLSGVGDVPAAKAGGMDDKMVIFLEFRADGTGGMGIEVNDPELKKIMGDGKDKMPSFKWTVSGDTLELSEASGGKGEGGPFGKKDKARGKIVFDGNDTVTINPEEAGEKAVKLTRMK